MPAVTFTTSPVVAVVLTVAPAPPFAIVTLFVAFAGIIPVITPTGITTPISVIANE